MVNLALLDMIPFNTQVSYAKQLYQALFESHSWWKQLNAYSSKLLGAKMGPKTSQSVGLLNKITMPFRADVMTDFYVQL
jgi:hypothetical protein